MLRRRPVRFRGANPVGLWVNWNFELPSQEGIDSLGSTLVLNNIQLQLGVNISITDWMESLACEKTWCLMCHLHFASFANCYHPHPWSLKQEIQETHDCNENFELLKHYKTDVGLLGDGASFRCGESRAGGLVSAIDGWNAKPVDSDSDGYPMHTGNLLLKFFHYVQVCFEASIMDQELPAQVQPPRPKTRRGL